MAREAFRSLYGTLAKIKAESGVRITGTGDDDELWEILAVASAAIDLRCNRHFYPRTQTQEFNGPGTNKLRVPDLISITSLKEDTTDDLTFDTTWATTDYFLEPANAAPTQPYGSPYTHLIVRAQGTKAAFDSGQRNFEIIGSWGYREHSEASGSLLDEGSDIDATQTAVVVDNGADFDIGQTIVLDSEQMLITNISTNTLTVTRALNGTAGAIHLNNVQVNTLRWPHQAERAAIMMTAVAFKSAPSIAQSVANLDITDEIDRLLAPLKRLAI